MAAIEWAPRVRQAHIRRLYESDAAGVGDEELLNEVGWGLRARCVSFIEAMDARNGRAKCHGCGAIILHTKDRAEVLRCAACGWEITWGEYFTSMQHKQLSGAEPIVEFYRGYVDAFPRAASYAEKMLLVDRLIHGFHTYARYGPTRAACVNLIEGGYREVVEFLDRLTYGEGSTPGTRDTLAEWRATVNYTADLWGAAWLRRVGEDS